MYKYLSQEQTSVVNLATSRCVYLAQEPTIHTEAYLEWVADGGVTEPADPPVVRPIVIADISPRQIRMALTRAGLRDSVEAAVASGDQDLKDWYEFSTAFERSNPLVGAMGTALGVSSEALDGLWQLGATL